MARIWGAIYESLVILNRGSVYFLKDGLPRSERQGARTLGLPWALPLAGVMESSDVFSLFYHSVFRRRANAGVSEASSRTPAPTASSAGKNTTPKC